MKSHSIMQCYLADMLIAELEAENARLRKVADLTVEWFKCSESNVNNVWRLLEGAVREYRAAKELPQTCHNELTLVTDQCNLNQAYREITDKKLNGE